ncbi:hypothetical protein HPB49_012168 [Dermacentor silvarum]|uniref:Uncharacterized protein n=1 Tax=Dermacentor silvarum TaxID=543639 RepID=A0ACB8CQY2_DERSI|nr:hypothetical protein HPB49_012168 [Dermacentor silvarum]
MRVEVDGIEISPDQCTRAQGWKTAGERVRQKGMGKLGLNPVLQTSQDGAKATADVNSRSNNLGGGAPGSDTRHSTAKRVNKSKLLKGAASKQRGRSQTPVRSSSNNSGKGNGRQSRSRSKTPSEGGNGGGNRRSCSRASSRSRSESTGRRGIAEKKVGWTNRSPVARTSDTELPPLPPSHPLNSQTNPQKDSSEIQEQNAQIRALMNKIETLVSNGSSAKTRPQNNTTAANNAGGLRKVPRRDSPSPRLGRAAGEAGATQCAPNNQEAMDADESSASGEEAATSETVTTATTQIPRGGELTAILAAISQIDERLGKMDARLEAVENQLNTPAVKHKRLALKVASTSLRNRFTSLKRERAERVKDAITKRRNRLETSGKDDAEPKKQTGNQDSRDVSWRCEEVDLGSDHSVISITIRGSRYRAVLGRARITDWVKMRKFTQEQEEASEEELGQGRGKPATLPQGKSASPKLEKHPPQPRLPATDFKIVFRPGGGLDLRPMNGGALLPILCAGAEIDYNQARSQDKLRINPHNNSLTLQGLQLNDKQYPMKTYVAAPDNAIKGILYNAVYNQSQENIFEDLVALNPSRTFTIADARQRGRTKCILVRFDRSGNSSNNTATSTTRKTTPASPPLCLHPRVSETQEVTTDHLQGAEAVREQAPNKAAIQAVRCRSRHSQGKNTGTSTNRYAGVRNFLHSRKKTRSSELAHQSREISELKQQLQALLRRDHSPVMLPPVVQIRTRADVPGSPSAFRPSASPSRATSPTRSPPAKRKSNTENELASQPVAEQLTLVTTSLQTLERALHSLHSDTASWMTNISTRFGAIGKRQCAQEASYS